MDAERRQAAAIARAYSERHGVPHGLFIAREIEEAPVPEPKGLLATLRIGWKAIGDVALAERAIHERENLRAELAATKREMDTMRHEWHAEVADVIRTERARFQAFVAALDKKPIGR